MKKKSVLRSGAFQTTLALGMVVGIGGIATAASFTDFGNVNAQEQGIGSPNPFDIALVRDDVVVQGDSPDGVEWAIGESGQGKLMPGHELAAEIPVFNNATDLRAETVMTIEALDNGTAGSAPDPASLYRFSAIDTTTGEVIFGNPADPVNGVALASIGNVGIGTLAARGASSLDDGSPWVPGQPGSHRVIKLVIAYPDSAESEQFNGGKSRLLVRFKASSTS